MKPKIFIGSSTEGKEVADAIHADLQEDAECTVWTQGVFELSNSNTESLMAQVKTSEFGIFVFSPDDQLKMRGHLFAAPRDNVVYELGLFSGALRPERCFFVTPRGTPIHLPSDVLGMTAGWYETGRRDLNMRAAVAPFCTEVRKKLKVMWVAVKFVEPQPNARLDIGFQRITCQSTSALGPNTFVFTQKGNTWWPRSERLQKVSDDTYTLRTWFDGAGHQRVHIVKTNDLATITTESYLKSSKTLNDVKEWHGEKRSGRPFWYGKSYRRVLTA